MNPKPALYDVKDRGLSLADSIILQIDGALNGEDEPVRALALNAVYDRVAGRIAACG